MTVVGRFAADRRRFYAACVIACAVIGLAVRAVAASGDAWLDEIWSWQLAQSGDVLGAHDNNHLLNTLWLWLWTDTRVALIWRMPAVLSGAASIVMSAILLRRLGRAHAVCGAVLMTVSHPMVVYQSEARGYALMLLCVLIAIELQLRLIESVPTRALRIGMALVAIAGVLAHLSFAIVYGLIAVAGLALRWRREGTSSIRTTLFDHGVGAIGIAIWLGTFGRQMCIGGGPELETTAVLGQTFQSIGAFTWITPAIVVACAVRSFSRHRALILLLATVAVAYPLAVLVLKEQLIYVRYFLPMIAASTLLLGAGMGELVSRPRLRYVAAGYVLLLICVHVANLLPLLTVGRDQHRVAIARIAMEATSGMTIASDSDAQLKSILSYHSDAFRTCATPQVLQPAAAPRWWIVMRAGGPDRVRHADHAYTLRASYKAHGLSGVPWLIYERMDGAPERLNWTSAQTYAE